MNMIFVAIVLMKKNVQDALVYLWWEANIAKNMICPGDTTALKTAGDYNFHPRVTLKLMNTVHSDKQISQ